MGTRGRKEGTADSVPVAVAGTAVSVPEEEEGKAAKNALNAIALDISRESARRSKIGEVHVDAA